MGQPAWKDVLDRYAVPDDRRSALQVVVTVLLLAVGVVACALALRVGYWLTLLLAIPTALMLVRVFTIFHELSHRSLFSRPRVNVAVGIALSLLLWTPFHQWSRRHALHHATSGDLGRRGWWEIPTMTVREYAAASRSQRWAYRAQRSTSLLFTVIATIFFLLVQRFGTPGARPRERVGVWATDLALAGIAAGAIALWGIGPVLAVWLPIAVLAAAGGFWLFYVQHQFEDAYWVESADWSFTDAALRGSSFVRMPAPLEWATLCIGFHHIHHLHPRIPNYRLAAAHRDNPTFHVAPTFTLRQTIPALRAQVWDGARLVPLRALHRGGSGA